ncbi:MAG: hypothetical protein HOF43_07450 [Chloroflexi bacterium]|nr:hypothetical protein [Chloroflexota bacterium]
MSNSDDPGDRRRSNRGQPVNQNGRLIGALDGGPVEDEPPSTSAPDAGFRGDGPDPAEIQTGFLR